ncbi:hypothetical protein VTO42DRAFT_2198 [Malbranchea cinnamomea]
MSHTHLSPTSAPGAIPTPVSELPQAQVDAIIRTKRKAREPKACYPCHTRKVKCDRNLPCDGCVKRDHADLCSYERPSKKRQTIAQPIAERGFGETSGDLKPIQTSIQPSVTETGRISLSREEWNDVCSKLKDMERLVSSLRSGMERADPTHRVSPEMGQGRSEEGIPEREGIHAANELGEGTTYLGARSVLAYLLDKSGSSQETAQALLEGGILPKLGLDNESATYPFVDLWSTGNSAFDVGTVISALPDDEQCWKLFRFYRDIAATIYPVLPDIETFERKLEQFLRNRSLSNGNVNNSEQLECPYGMSVAFLGLLFAILAAGCQSSDLPGKNRELTSQVYVCCSYQCLRVTNFMSRPTIEAIQTLLIIGNVLSYNMNPGVSYILLGMTLRMGLSLGLQVESQHFSPDDRFIRRRVWWSMAWQDSHFSLSYDRPSTMAFGHPDIPYHPNSAPKRRSFFETLCRIISLTLEIVRGRMLSPSTQMSFKVIQNYKNQLKEILDDASPYLRDSKFCTSTKENVERLGLKLHSSYIMSELCRPALKPEFDDNDGVAAMLRKDCITALTKTVEAYVELHATDSHATRSWIGLQRSISSAFLLAVIPESKTDPKILGLLRQLETVIADRAAADEALIQNTSSGTSTSSAQMTSPRLYHAPSKATVSGTIAMGGTTNVPVSPFDQCPNPPISIPASVPIDIEGQWAKPLLKSLRALQKLNGAFAAHFGQQQQGNGQASVPLTPNVAATVGGQFQPPSSAPPGSSTMTSQRSGSIPPVTPESSGSGDWTFPNLIDRAAEYIPPPLWG